MEWNWILLNLLALFSPEVNVTSWAFLHKCKTVLYWLCHTSLSEILLNSMQIDSWCWPHLALFVCMLLMNERIILLWPLWSHQSVRNPQLCEATPITTTTPSTMITSTHHFCCLIYWNAPWWHGHTNCDDHRVDETTIPTVGVFTLLYTHFLP